MTEPLLREGLMWERGRAPGRVRARRDGNEAPFQVPPRRWDPRGTSDIPRAGPSAPSRAEAAPAPGQGN